MPHMAIGKGDVLYLKHSRAVFVSPMQPEAIEPLLHVSQLIGCRPVVL